VQREPERGGGVPLLQGLAVIAPGSKPTALELEMLEIVSRNPLFGPMNRTQSQTLGRLQRRGYVYYGYKRDNVHATQGYYLTEEGEKL
jgi:hypothetical protein